jgi:hypothetical protein
MIITLGEEKRLAAGFFRGDISIFRGVFGYKFSGIVEGGILSGKEVLSKGEDFCTGNTCWHFEQRTLALPSGMRSSSRLNLIRHIGQVIIIYQL